MLDLPWPARRLVGAAVVGVAFVAAPIAALTDTPSQPVAQTACSGNESIVDGTETCVPGPAVPDASNPQSGTPDGQLHDGNHH